MIVEDGSRESEAELDPRAFDLSGELGLDERVHEQPLYRAGLCQDNP